MKIKKIFKKSKKILKMLNFKESPSDREDLEIESFCYRNGDYLAYLHRYEKSFRFYILNEDTKEECRFEIWKTKQSSERPNYDNGLTYIFDFVYGYSIKMRNEKTRNKSRK